ncbi:MAG TPA: hypothetical protein GX395_07920 [Clostridia bacterium]|nr:hypothetical protein [Clostridia bacterium]
MTKRKRSQKNLMSLENRKNPMSRKQENLDRNQNLVIQSLKNRKHLKVRKNLKNRKVRLIQEQKINEAEAGKNQDKQFFAGVTGTSCDELAKAALG